MAEDTKKNHKEKMLLTFILSIVSQSVDLLIRQPKYKSPGIGKRTE